jgi:formyl-CoA transferase
VTGGIPETAAPPLAGIRVLEVGNYMAGPFCAMQLADLGADVVKVESPAAGGDEVRRTEPFLGPERESSNFVRLNRNKRSLALDLKAAAGKTLFRELVLGADVVVENLRPGTMADLELDYPRLRELNPKLVYVAASGWGQTGPYSGLAGLDIMAQGMCGLMSITGEPGGDPVKVGVPVTDLVCALYGALACLAALRARERDGRGQLIDVSLFEAGVSLAVWEAGRYFGAGEVPEPLGSAHQSSAPYQAFRASDGWFTLGATSPRNWHALCAVLETPELESDERFVDNASRHRHRGELAELIEQVTSRRPARHWLDRLQAAGVPCGAIQNYGEVFADAHLAARDFFWEGPHSTLGPVRQLGSPMRFSATPVRRRSAGPRLGEHSAEVLRELGRPEEEIARLAAEGVIVVAFRR